MSTTRTVAAIAPVLLAAACGCGGGPPGPRVEPPTPPVENDYGYVVTMPSWRLVGDAVTPAQNQLTITIDAPDDIDYVDVWVANRPGVRLEVQDEETATFTATIDVADLAVGAYDVLFAANSRTDAFAKLPLYRSHPYYVLMTTDWDFADPSQQALDRHGLMHARHPELVITHFPGPYTFTDPTVTEPRRAELAAWLIAQRDTFGDEIGLHIHPYCNFVESAGLTCITDQSTVYPNDATGYTIKVSAYGETDFATLLRHADTLFAARGLGKPTTFRAGGWTASIETLRALAATGYVADTSALNWARLEEWIGQGTGELYNWNMAAWGPIGDTSQPYYPNQDDAVLDTAPNIALLEVPDNGIMVDYVTVDEMKMIFAANWNGTTPLAEPTTLMMGFHPASQFGNFEHSRVDGILDHADQFLASNGTGPVVYALLNQMPAVFTR